MPPDAFPPDAMPPPDAMVSPAGPVISVTFPLASTSTSADDMVVTNSLTARCQVSPNTDSQSPVDSSSVTMSAIVGTASLVVDAVPEGGGVFAATFDLSSFPNGVLQVVCTASDLATVPQTNSGDISVHLDLGPLVRVVRPLPGESKGSGMEIFFEVVPWPVTGDLATDPGAALGTPVELSVAGRAMTLTSVPGNFYSATVDFTNPFSPSLAGLVRFEVRAPNTRQTSAAAAAPVTRSVKATFVADEGGPIVSITSPAPSALVSGLVTVTATVQDPAGVSRVTGILGHGSASELTFELFSGGPGDTYTGVVDTRQLNNAGFVFPLLEVRAEDTVGNASAAGHVISLDNRRPLVTLDSPRIREALLAEDNSTILGCSKLFDPLGDDAVSLGQTVGALSEFRVRAEDRGNGPEPAPDGIYIPMATVDPGSVQLYVLDDENGELIVDLDGDNECDDINPTVAPTTVPNTATEAALVSLAAIDPTGESHFTTPVVPYGTNSSDFDNKCNGVTPAISAAPPPLCGFPSPLTRAISTETDSSPAIFGIKPVGGFACLGNAFDAPATNIKDGWACVVARAVDTLGNVGMSKPMPVCFETGGANDCAPPAGGVASLCAITCTLSQFSDHPDRQLRKLVISGPECSDGIDNDGDTLVDLDDPDCNGSPLGESEAAAAL